MSLVAMPCCVLLIEVISLAILNTAAFFKTQHASFCVRCGGLTAVGGGNGTLRSVIRAASVDVA
jgi:hypothetical protein